jgi:hypothetical protein
MSKQVTDVTGLLRLDALESGGCCARLTAGESAHSSAAAGVAYRGCRR